MISDQVNKDNKKERYAMSSGVIEAKHLTSEQSENCSQPSLDKVKQGKDTQRRTWISSFFSPYSPGFRSFRQRYGKAADLIPESTLRFRADQSSPPSSLLLTRCGQTRNIDKSLRKACCLREPAVPCRVFLPHAGRQMRYCLPCYGAGPAASAASSSSTVSP